jgi:hypothetical protein
MWPGLVAMQVGIALGLVFRVARTRVTIDKRTSTLEKRLIVIMPVHRKRCDLAAMRLVHIRALGAAQSVPRFAICMFASAAREVRIFSLESHSECRTYAQKIATFLDLPLLDLSTVFGDNRLSQEPTGEGEMALSVSRLLWDDPPRDSQITVTCENDTLHIGLPRPNERSRVTLFVNLWALDLITVTVFLVTTFFWIDPANAPAWFVALVAVGFAVTAVRAYHRLGRLDEREQLLLNPRELTIERHNENKCKMHRFGLKQLTDLELNPSTTLDNPTNRALRRRSGLSVVADKQSLTFGQMLSNSEANWLYLALAATLQQFAQAERPVSAVDEPN